MASARVATTPAATMPWYRSAPRAASAIAVSPLMPASTRGSSCATSATTKRRPSSATAAGRTWAGTDSAPPPLDAQRPVTTPPGTNQARNRPSRTQASSHAQPFAVSSRASFRYSRRAGIAGWSSCSSVHERVSATGSPADRSARSRSAGESELRSGTPSPARTSPASCSRTAGRRPASGRGPRSPVSSRSWTSARQGRPACVISAATRAPEDSAASSRPSRAPPSDPRGLPAAARARRRGRGGPRDRPAGTARRPRR